MNIRLESVTLRRPEPSDVDSIYLYKNDPEIARQLGGFSVGYARADIEDWVERRRSEKSEIVWVIADKDSDECLGHVGLYQIDQRIGSAELAIMIGAHRAQGKGLGRMCCQFAISYGFDQLNLNRVYLSVLETNVRAVRLYRSLGFRDEGLLRQAQYKDGRYIDVRMMSMLRSDSQCDDQ